MKEIQLVPGKVALVDDDDFALVSRFKWRVTNYGYVQTRMYMGRIGGKQKNGHMFLHCLIMRPPYPLEVDHIHHNKLDCRRKNMRICTRSQNNQNQKKTRGTSKYKGVHWRKRGAKWRADIRFNGKGIHLGYFTDEVDAARAYDAKAKDLFGEYAYLNFQGDV